MDGELAEPPLIVELSGHLFGFMKIADDALEFSERHERSLQVESKINGLLQRIAGLRQRLQDMQRLLEEFGGLAVSSPLTKSALDEVGMV